MDKTELGQAIARRAQMGVTNAMAFDSNTHADFWRKGAAAISSGGGEPATPTTTILRSH